MLPLSPEGPTFGPETWSYLIPLLVIGLVILRNSRGRTLKVERLWISPAILTALTLAVFATNPPPGLLGAGVDILAAGLGALLGWWRGRASRFTIDPEPHVVTSRVSPIGMLLILGIFALRSFCAACWAARPRCCTSRRPRSPTASSCWRSAWSPPSAWSGGSAPAA